MLKAEVGVGDTRKAGPEMQFSEDAATPTGVSPTRRQGVSNNMERSPSPLDRAWPRPSGITKATGSGYGPLTKLSFFDNYTVVDGVVQEAVFVSAGHINSYKISRSSRWILLEDDQNKCLWVSEPHGRKPAHQIDCDISNTGDYCFRGNAEDAILCIDKEGLLTSWKWTPSGTWVQKMKHKFPMGCETFAVSNNGRYLASLSKSGARTSIALYNISGINPIVTEVGAIQLAGSGSTGDLLFSPSGCCLLVYGEVGGPFVCHTESDAGVHVKGSNGWWLGDTTLVTWEEETGHSLLWDFQALLPPVDGSATVIQNTEFELAPEMEFQGAVLGAGGGRVFVQDKENPLRVFVWDIEASEVLAQFDHEVDEEWASACCGDQFLLCVSDNGDWVATCAGGVLRVWSGPDHVQVGSSRLQNELWDKVGSADSMLAFKGRNIMLLNAVDQETALLVCTFHVLNGECLLSHDLPDSCFSCDFKMSGNGGVIGALLLPQNSDAYNVWIWDVSANAVLTLERKASSVEAFGLSFVGDKAATVSDDGVVAVWNVHGMTGTLHQHQELTDLNSMEISNTFLTFNGVSFTYDAKWVEMVVVLVNGGVLVWIDTEGDLVHKAQVSVDPSIAHRFSGSGHACAILLQTYEVQVWDLVRRRRHRCHQYSIPIELDRGIKCTISPQQLSINGRRMVLGVDERAEPWLISHDQDVECKDFELWKAVPFSSYGGSSILGQIGCISESGEHTATCVKVDGSMLQLVIQPVGEETVGGSCKVIEFQTDTHLSGSLVMSSNGQRIAWATDKQIRMWDPYGDGRCLPSYAQMKSKKHISNAEDVEDLLYTCGRNLLNFPDGGGSTFLARAIEDRNVEVVRVIVEWAKANKAPVLLKGSVHGSQQDDLDENLLQLAIDTQLPECVHLLIKGTLSGVVVSPNREKVMYKTLCNIIGIYPILFRYALHDPNMLQPTGELYFPYHAFKGAPFLVCTSDELCPKNLEEFWSKQASSLVDTRIWSLIEKLRFWRKEERIGEAIMNVRSQSYVVPIDDFAQVGTKGLLGEIVNQGIRQQAFSAVPLKAMIQYKWFAYGKDLLYDQLCSFLLLLVVFTVYSILLGATCRVTGGLGGSLDIACGVFLAISMVLSACALYNELKQMACYWREGRQQSFYWLRSKWNGIEFATYALMLIVIPIFQFGANPCTSKWATSFAVPLASIFLWWKILYYAQAFWSTGVIVLMIFAIIGDIFYFLIIGVGVMFGFGVAFFVLYHAEDEEIFASIGKAQVSTFAVMIGAFDLEVFYGSEAFEMAIIFFVVYVLVMAIILLNLLIAIMGDSYDRIKEAEGVQFLMARASIIDDMESMMPNAVKQKIGERIGRFVHVLIPRGGFEDTEEWHGRMMELERRFTRVVTESENKLDGIIKDASNETNDLLTTRMTEIETKLEWFIKQRLDSLEQKVVETAEKAYTSEVD